MNSRRRLVFIFCMLFLILPACSQKRSKWVSLAPLRSPRQEMGVVAVGGKIYAVGGLDKEGQGLRTVEVYHPDANRWSFVQALPLPLHHAAAADVEGVLYLVGGFEGSSFEFATNLVWAYYPASGQWRLRAPMPTRRGALAVAVYQKEIYAVGGFRDGHSVSDFAVYDVAQDRWSSLPPMPTRRDHLAAVAIPDIIAISGRKDGMNLSEVERYDVGRQVWSAVASIPTPRSGFAAVNMGGQVYTFGGEGNLHRSDGLIYETEIYDPVKGRWRVDVFMKTPRHGIGAGFYNGMIYIPGGATRQGLKATEIHEAYMLQSP